jgi:acid phosphatase
MLTHARRIGLAALLLAGCAGDNTGTDQDVAPGGDDVQGADIARPDAGGMDAARTDAARTDAAPGDVVQDRVAPGDAARDAATPVDVPTPVDAQADAGGPADAVSPTDAAPADSGGACGTCAAGFHCGPSGYCVSADGVPAFGHVYLVVMENHSLSSILGASAAPYINTMMTDFAYASHYVTRASGDIHPSLPNYIAMTSGDTFGIDCDCSPASPSLSARASCLTATTSSSCPQAATHMGDQLDAVSVAWRAYGEGMSTPCNTTDSGNYVARHIPFLYYNNVRTDAARCTARVRDYGDFAGDLRGGAYRFSMISPDLCNDMHGNGLGGLFDTCGGTAVGNGNGWLAREMPAIRMTAGFLAGGTDVLFIVWDEEDGSTGSEPIPLIVVSPLVRPHTVTATPYDHYSLLATVLSGLGATRVGSTEARAAHVIDDIWR